MEAARRVLEAPTPSLDQHSKREKVLAVANSLPPIVRPEPKPEAKSPEQREPLSKVTNELTVLAEFIREHANVEFDRHLAILLAECGTQHDIYASNCQENHWYTEVPCEDYERSMSLGIAWLKARIAQEASNAS